MGRDVVHFKCHSCGHCCTDVVCLPTPWDVVRIVRDTKRHPLEFLTFIQPDEITGVDKNDPTWLDVDGEKYMMALYRDAKGCFFLDKKTKRCTIYDSRPILCRLYPFKLNETREGDFKGFSLHKDVGCPKNRDGVVETEPLYELYLDDSVHHRDYDGLVDAFNEKEYEGKKPEDFLDLFIEVKTKKVVKPRRVEKKKAVRAKGR
jgi:Fe-S-cluster containining protein